MRKQRDRWCKFCEEQFELTDQQVEDQDDTHQECGRESVAWEDSGVRCDNEEYERKAPR